MKNIVLCTLMMMISLVASASPKYEFTNKGQQVEIQNAVYDLVIKNNSKQCPISARVITNVDNFVVLNRYVYVDILIKNKSLVYNELDLSNWSKFKYEFSNLVINTCK